MRLLLSAQALAAATAPDLQPLAKAPAELAAWLHSAERDLWGALWQPLLIFREEWQVCRRGTDNSVAF